MTVAVLLNLMVYYGILTHPEAHECLMTGKLPDDIMERIEKLKKKVPKTNRQIILDSLRMN